MSAAVGSIAKPRSLSQRLQSRVLELDGLRFFAIIPVLLDHFWPTKGPWARAHWIPESGWIGVDLFFVLSGFLITGILLDSRDDPHYYRNFIARRILRIFPLYYGLVTGVLLYSRLADHGSAYFTLVNEWGGPAWFYLYAGNIRAAMLNGWPTIFSLTPLWSVHVEEQFYLTYPLLVAAVSRRSLARFLWIFAGAAIAIRICLLILFPANVKLQYALMPCRMDGFAVGGLIAHRLRYHEWPLSSRATSTLALIGGGLILAIMAIGGPKPDSALMRTAGFALLAATFGLTLAWTCLNLDRRSTALLRWKPLCYIGQISYGLYLLHAPVAFAMKGVLVRLHLGEIDKTLPAMFLYMAAAVGAASLSWYWFEKPILRLRKYFVS